MATLEIATAFVVSSPLRKRASTGAVRGFQGRKTLQVSCQQSAVDVEGQRSGGSESDDGDQKAVSIFQSSRNPLLNLSQEELAALAEKENCVDAAIVNAVDSGARRRSDRVVFTAEKARLLRKENRATQCFHDKCNELNDTFAPDFSRSNIFYPGRCNEDPDKFSHRKA